MRMFIFLILLAALALWLGVALRDIYKRYSNIAFVIGGILGLLALAGFYGWI